MRSYVTYDVPLLGPGLTYRPNAQYQQGEYSTLRNLDVMPDGVRTRRCFKSIGSQAALPGSSRGDYHFVGVAQQDFSTPDIVMLSSTSMNASVPNADTFGIQNKANFVPASAAKMDQITVGSLWYNTFAAFKYNDIYYQFGIRLQTTTPGYTACYYSSPVNFGDSAGTITSYNATNGPPITGAPVGGWGSNPINTMSVVASFMFKDRLWVVTPDQLSYSKATDPTVWTTAGGGGFIRLPDSNILYAFPFRDTIYICTDSSIYSHTYSNDPFLDGSLRLMDPNHGAFYGCAARGNVYFAGEAGIYALNNGYLELIVGTRLSDIQVYSRQKLIAFEDSLILLKATNNGLAGVCYSINLDSGGLSLYDFGGSFAAGFIWDAVSVVEPNNDETLHLIVKDPATRNIETYYMRSNRTADDNMAGVDERYGVAVRNVDWELELPTLQVDGLDYTMKKIRHYFVTGRVREAGHSINFMTSYSEANTYNHSDTLVPANDGINWTYPRVYRFPGGQRGLSLSVKMRSDPTRDTKSSIFYLNDIKIFWTNVNRQVVSRVSNDTA